MIRLSPYTASRYVQPPRQGESLSAILDSDGGLFVTKFRGAGQGARALVADVLPCPAVYEGVGDDPVAVLTGLFRSFLGE